MSEKHHYKRIGSNIPIVNRANNSGGVAGSLSMHKCPGKLRKAITELANDEGNLCIFLEGRLTARHIVTVLLTPFSWLFAFTGNINRNVKIQFNFDSSERRLSHMDSVNLRHVPQLALRLIVRCNAWGLLNASS